MKLDERHLIQLAAVVQTGSVTEGASLLGMTQPALSRTIGMLEGRLGQPLFCKGRRPLEPTPLGRALADHGQAMLIASRKASETVAGFRQGRAGVVRAGGVPFFMDALISGMVAEFQNAHGEVRVEQSYGHLPELRARLEADAIDLAVCPLDILEEGSGLSFQKILPGHNVIACRSTHPLLGRRKLSGAEVLDFPWIAPLPGSPLLEDMRAILLSLGVGEVKTRYSGGSLWSVLNYLAATDALAVLPHSVVFAVRKTGTVSVLPVKIPQRERTLGLLRRTDAPPSTAADHFARHLVASFEALRHLIARHEQAVIWSA